MFPTAVDHVVDSAHDVDKPLVIAVAAVLVVMPSTVSRVWSVVGDLVSG